MLRLQVKAPPGPSARPATHAAAAAADRAAAEPWSAAHAPKTVADLHLHHSKRAAITGWLQRASAYRMHSGARLPVLLLYGKSGIGKSRAVELFCAELGVEVTHWHQDMLESDSVSRSSLFKFRDHASVIAADIVVHVVDRQRGLSQPYSGSQSRALVQDLFQISVHESGRKEQARALFSAAKYPSLILAAKDGSVVSASPALSSSPRVPNRILLVHDPLLPTDPGFHQFSDLLLQSSLPVVLVASGAFEREDRWTAQRQHLDAAARSTCDVECVYWTPMTEPKLVKVLAAAVKRERVAVGQVSEDELRSIAAQSLGDVRHALIELEVLVKTRRAAAASWPAKAPLFHLVSEEEETNESTLGAKKRRRPNAADGDREGESEGGDLPRESHGTASRDPATSQIHMMAKLLHSKLDNQGWADVDVDQLLRSSDCSCDWLLGSMALNCADFIDEQMSVPVENCAAEPEQRGLSVLEAMSNTADLLGDAEMLLARKYDAAAHLDRSSDAVFPEPYVYALAARAALVSKGRGLRELTVQARERMHYKTPFRGIKAGEAFRHRAAQTQHAELLRAMQREGQAAWIELTSRDQEEVERADFVGATFAGRYLEPLLVSQKHMLPQHSAREWALSVVPYCRTMSACCPPGRAPLLADWWGRHAGASPIADARDEGQGPDDVDEA